MGYIIYPVPDATAIYAIGATEADAWADLRDAIGPEIDTDHYECCPATDGLLAAVERCGGDIAWSELGDGTACTDAEAEAERGALDALRDERAARVAAIVAGQHTDDCTWAATRREMLERMAWAHVSGDRRVTLSARGTLLWAAAVPSRHDASPNDPRPVRLAHAEAHAAEEMATNLGVTTWRDRLAVAATTRRAQARADLIAIGTALYGHEWVSPLAAALDVAVRTVQRWAAGDFEVPRTVAERDLPALARGPVGDAVVQTLRARLGTLETLRIA